MAVKMAYPPAPRPSSYVEQEEFDQFRGEVVGKLANIERAITNDARSRAERDRAITDQLSVLTSQYRKSESEHPKFEDITGRFEIEGKKILRKAQVRGGGKTIALTGVGATIAYTIVEIVKAYFLMKGH
jgi:hypothetical protein